MCPGQPAPHLGDEQHEDALGLAVEAHQPANKDLLLLALHGAGQQEEHQLFNFRHRSLFGDGHEVGQLGGVNDLVQVRLVEPLDVPQQPAQLKGQETASHER